MKHAAPVFEIGVGKSYSIPLHGWIAVIFVQLSRRDTLTQNPVYDIISDYRNLLVYDSVRRLRYKREHGDRIRKGCGSNEIPVVSCFRNEKESGRGGSAKDHSRYTGTRSHVRPHASW